MDPAIPHPEVHVREHPLPGSARLFSLTLSDGTVVSVATHPDVQRQELSITPADRDQAVATVRLRAAEATTLAALLSGVRFTIEAAPEEQPVRAANLRTVTLGAGSPAVGRTLEEITAGESEDAMVIAVIRDDTPDLVEQDPQRPCQPGDRLVLVGRPGAMRELVSFLLG